MPLFNKETLARANSELAGRHLETAIADLERDVVASRNVIWTVRKLTAAASVLGRKDLSARAQVLLQVAPDDAFFAGAIANFELPRPVPTSMRTIDSREEAEKHYPPYSEDAIRGRIRRLAKAERHFRLCLKGRWLQACSRAKTGRELEEIGNAMAVLGDLKAALAIADSPTLEPFRQDGIKFVVTIEASRRGLLEEYSEMISIIERNLASDERIQYALGVGGREPWTGYPFPDW